MYNYEKKLLMRKLFVRSLLISPIILLVLSVIFIDFDYSNERVSGIVYNTKNDTLISGSTTFSVRASEDTYVSEENISSYCLPKNSEYIELVNQAAEDKNIKVVVTTKRYFVIKAPWTCIDNVKVTEVK